MSPRIKELAGQSFGKWMVISYAGRSSWNCQCACGIAGVIRTDQLLNDRSHGCKGCGRRRHGLAGSSEYSTWKGMKRRCLHPHNPRYPRYGGRGIKICNRWVAGEDGNTGFECFILDMGLRPSPDLSIDRIDNDGNYEPGNCRWATAREQRLNQGSRPQ